MTIIDVIQTRQAANDIYLAYFDAQSAHAKALASLLAAEGDAAAPL